MTLLRLFFSGLLTLASATTLATTPVVNVYVWGGEIPKSLIQSFEQHSGIHVNFSTYDSNETMFAKLKASHKPVYDVILPSGYFVERMKQQGMLERLDHQHIPNLSNLSNTFRNSAFDPGNEYSAPLTWGATGLFFNRNRVTDPPSRWRDLWDPRRANQLMLLDDSREVFAMALLALGFDANDRNPAHIKAAYERLLRLVPNIKLFASDSIQAIMIDEDAIAGSAWNGDVLKAQAENAAIAFHFPEDGFVIWADCLAVPKQAPHRKEAFAFINFMLQASSGASIALQEGHAITNHQSLALLPEAIRGNPMIYPPETVLRRGHFQRDVGEATLSLYNHYWERLKLAF